MKFKVDDWIELVYSEDLRNKSFSGYVNNCYLYGQSYDPKTQYGFYNDRSEFNKEYKFNVITYNKPYKISEIKTIDLDIYWFQFYNEYNIKISLQMDSYRHKIGNFVISKQKIREIRIDGIIKS